MDIRCCSLRDHVVPVWRHSRQRQALPFRAVLELASALHLVLRVPPNPWPDRSDHTPFVDRTGSSTVFDQVLIPTCGNGLPPQCSSISPSASIDIIQRSPKSILY
uniref:Uncharacterized protein n=1 Tax=Spongospora subterranea TaxID=70186 RepID=A0A0H5R6I9_9EUKA|eukprot:CRZ03884.1 hypothetical protein [Spongospora subterranea]